MLKSRDVVLVNPRSLGDVGLSYRHVLYCILLHPQGACTLYCREHPEDDININIIAIRYYRLQIIGFHS